MKYKIGDQFVLLIEQLDDDDGIERITPVGSVVTILPIFPKQEAAYVVGCPATGGSWFFSEPELDAQCRRVRLTKQGVIVRCPTTEPDGSPQQSVKGCGGAILTYSTDECLYDCECGIWFYPEYADPTHTKEDAVLEQGDGTAVEALNGALGACVHLSLKPNVSVFPHAVRYLLAIDGPLFREQRQAIGELIAHAAGTAQRELYIGIQNLLDAIADQAHDHYGIDCLSIDDAHDTHDPGSPPANGNA